MITNLLDRLKLPFRKDKELYSSLYDIMGFYPHKLEIYKVALSHKSAEYRNSEGNRLNNERLEFLGDAILEAAVSDIVFHHFENKREGFLTSTRSKLVQRKTLNNLATETGLDQLINSTAKTSAHNSYLGGNAFEALIGAIYLDRGYAYCKWFINRRILGKLIDIDGLAHKEVNFKSRLLEWSQKNRIQTEFQLDDTINNSGNSPQFTSKILIEGILTGEGTGYSKKESQQKAAKEALLKLRREPQFIKKIFLAKEKRTAMEADEFSVLPRIEEIEEEISQAEGRKPELRTERPVKRRTRKTAREAAKNEAAAATEESIAPKAAANNGVPDSIRKSEPRTQNRQEAAPQSETPARKRSRRRSAKPADAAAAEGQKPETKETAAKNEAQAKPDTDAPAEDASQRRRGRTRRPRKKEGEEGTAQMPDREEIIRAAEEAAFNQA